MVVKLQQPEAQAVLAAWQPQTADARLVPSSVLSLHEYKALLDAEQGEFSPLLPLVASTLETLVDEGERKEREALQTSSPDGTSAPRLTVFHGLRAPPITIDAYLLRIAKYAKCSPACFVAALGYMRRLAGLDACYVPTTLNVHRLLLTGVLLAAKFLDDRYYNNAFYAKVGGISTPELNRLELEMLKLLSFRLATTGEEVATLLAQLHNGSYAFGDAAGAVMISSANSLLLTGAILVDPVAAAAAAAGTGCGCSCVGYAKAAALAGEPAGYGRKRRSMGSMECDVRPRLQRRSMDAIQPEA